MASGQQAPSGGSHSQVDFRNMVDLHIAKHPLVQPPGALASNALRFCVAKLLLRGQLADWPGQGSTRLCAIMLVLFVRECLMHYQDKILGFDSHDFYELLAGVIRAERVSQEVLMAELIEIDVDGATTIVASSKHLREHLWSDDGSRSYKTADTITTDTFNDANERASRSAWSDDSLLPEAARASNDTWFGGLASPALAVVRRKLFLRSLRFRFACAAVSILWFLAVEFTVFKRLYGNDVAQVAMFCTTSSFGTCVAVCFFPSDLASQKRFTLLPSCVTALSVCAATYLEFFFRSEAHVNAPCTLIHGALCLVTSAAWSSAAVLSALGRYTWTCVRLVYLFDGAAFLLATLLMRTLGPPISYPPGNIPLPVSLCRAAFPLALSAVITPARRLRASALANGAGWNHVVLNLDEVKKSGGDGRVEIPAGRKQQ